MKDIIAIFNKFVTKKTYNQLFIIDKICKNCELDSEIWFNNFINNEVEIYSGCDFLNNMLDNFSVFLTQQFTNNFLEYVEPNGYRIYKKPYYNIFIDVFNTTNSTNITFKLHIDDDNLENLINITKKLTLAQKHEILKNKTFSYVIKQTNFDFLSNNDIRALKLRSLNEYLQYNK